MTKFHQITPLTFMDSDLLLNLKQRVYLVNYTDIKSKTDITTKNKVIKIPKQLQIIPVIAIFLPSCPNCFISLKPMIPSINPITPRIIPNPVKIIVIIDKMPRIKAAMAFPFVIGFSELLY